MKTLYPVIPLKPRIHPVNVVEVRNPKPFDPNRKETNEANINKPLRFGSRTSITTAGNWE